MADKISVASDEESSFQYEGQGAKYDVLKDDKSPEEGDSGAGSSNRDQFDANAVSLPVITPIFRQNRKCGYYSIENDSD